jgi:hypothetical protein
MAKKMKPEDDLLGVVKALLEFGTWYQSAIELDTYDMHKVGLDGEKLEERAKRAVAEIERRPGAAKTPDAP